MPLMLCLQNLFLSPSLFLPFSLKILIPPLWGFSSLIQHPSIDNGLTLVNHLGLHLSAVPSDIPLPFLLVALAKMKLFTCLLYINAAGKVAPLHLMRQLWLPPECLAFSFYLGRFLTVYRACVGLPFGASEETLLLGRSLNMSDPTRLG